MGGRVVRVRFGSKVDQQGVGENGNQLFEVRVEELWQFLERL